MYVHQNSLDKALRSPSSPSRSMWIGLGGLSILGLFLLTTPALADDETKVVVRKHCPEIRIGDGEAVQFLGYSNRGFLGVELTNLTPELREHFGVPENQGVMVSRVVKGSAAEDAGLAVGDIITGVDGQEIGSAGSLGRAIRNRDGGETVEVEYWRDGEAQQTSATLAEHERCALDVSQYLEGIDFGEIGNLGIQISEEVMEGLAEALEGQDWEEHLQRFEDIDMEKFEERMELLQERLERLETELEREGERLEKERQQSLLEVEREQERLERRLQAAESEARAKEALALEKTEL